MLEVGPERIPELWRTVVEIVRAEGLALATTLQLERNPEVLGRWDAASPRA